MATPVGRWVLRLDMGGPGDHWPPSPNERLHWAARSGRNAAWRARTHVAAQEAHIPSLDRVRVTIMFHTAANKPHDEDNLISMCKPLYDGLVGYGGLPGVVADDNAAHMERGPVSEVRDGGDYVEITVEAIR